MSASETLKRNFYVDDLWKSLEVDSLWNWSKGVYLDGHGDLSPPPPSFCPSIVGTSILSTFFEEPHIYIHVFDITSYLSAFKADVENAFIKISPILGAPSIVKPLPTRNILLHPIKEEGLT